MLIEQARRHARLHVVFAEMTMSASSSRITNADTSGCSSSHAWISSPRRKRRPSASRHSCGVTEALYATDTSRSPRYACRPLVPSTRSCTSCHCTRTRVPRRRSTRLFPGRSRNPQAFRTRRRRSTRPSGNPACRDRAIECRPGGSGNRSRTRSRRRLRESHSNAARRRTDRRVRRESGGDAHRGSRRRVSR